MLRHLRRHVARGAEPFAIDFLTWPDPIRIADAMRSNRTAMVAFAEMVWSARMEAHVMRRRWPHRDVKQGFSGDYVGRALSPYVDFDKADGHWPDQEEHRWARYQASACMMISVWRESQRLAMQAVRTGIADWSMTVAADASRWAHVRDGRSFRFLCLRSQEAWDWALPLPDKPRRRQEQLAAAARRLQAVQKECDGLCLTWSELNGWSVLPSFTPERPRVDRHRLLGVGPGKPKFWLFQGNGQFVARACGVKLQVMAATPRESIDGLRKALTQHRRAYPQNVVHPAPLTAPRPSRDEARWQYELKLGIVLRNNGFWRGAPQLQAIARDYLRARSAGET